MAVRNLTTKARRGRTSARIERRTGTSPSKDGRAPSRSLDAAIDARVAAVREHLDDLQRSLGLVMSVVIVAVEALKAQNADHDAEVALVLRRHAGDRLYGQIEGIRALLRRLSPTSRRQK